MLYVPSRSPWHGGKFTELSWADPKGIDDTRVADYHNGRRNGEHQYEFVEAKQCPDFLGDTLIITEFQSHAGVIVVEFPISHFLQEIIWINKLYVMKGKKFISKFSVKNILNYFVDLNFVLYIWGIFSFVFKYSIRYIIRNERTLRKMNDLSLINGLILINRHKSVKN